MKKFIPLFLFLLNINTLAYATEIPPSLQPEISLEQRERMLQIRHPAEFKGKDELDTAVVSGYRQSHVQFKGAVPDAFYAFDNPAVYPLVEKLESRLKQLAPTSPAAKRLLLELDFQRNIQDVNPLWVLGMHFRLAASQSTITDDERNLFAHVPFPELYFSFLGNNAWRNILSSYVSLEEYDNQGLELTDDHLTQYTYGKVVDHVIEAVDANLPEPVRYPFLGGEKFGVSFLVQSYLDEIYPIGFPHRSIRGHGVTLSQFGFAVHDALHHKVDRRRYELKAHILGHVDRFMRDNPQGNAWQYAAVYTPIAMQRYLTLMGALTEIYQNFAGRLLIYRGLQEYRRVMAGYFWIMHEQPEFSRNIYDMNDLDKILTSITKSHFTAVNGALDEIDSWESPFDPLQTSPLDGTSALPDQAIYQWVLEHMSREQAQCYKYSAFPMTYPILQEEVVRRNVVRSNRFIDVILWTRQGEKLKFAFPTLYHKWQNIDDNLGLLRYAGTGIAKPDLSGIDDPRSIAQATLLKVEMEIANHVSHFRQVASFFANYDSKGDGDSIANRYFKRHFQQEQRLLKQLSENK